DKRDEIAAISYLISLISSLNSTPYPHTILLHSSCTPLACCAGGVQEECRKDASGHGQRIGNLISYILR
ncbi:MAG: hypothetical protein Q8M66_09160, partial [Actinomycetota bacterium]|nr:hypothetical protein [Actinomycetota bacterium]